MAALKDILAEQAKIKDELQRMESDDSITEEDSGNLRDTMIARWKELDEQAKPVIARMQEIKTITRTATDEANLERPGGSDGTSASRFGSPDLVIRTKRDPFDAMDEVSDNMLSRSELRERALDAVEQVASRCMFPDNWAEEATTKVERGGYFKENNVARHILETGSPEYYDAFEK